MTMTWWEDPGEGLADGIAGGGEVEGAVRLGFEAKELVRPVIEGWAAMSQAALAMTAAIPIRMTTDMRLRGAFS